MFQTGPSWHEPQVYHRTQADLQTGQSSWQRGQVTVSHCIPCCSDWSQKSHRSSWKNRWWNILQTIIHEYECLKSHVRISRSFFLAFKFLGFFFFNLFLLSRCHILWVSRKVMIFFILYYFLGQILSTWWVCLLLWAVDFPPEMMDSASR